MPQTNTRRAQCGTKPKYGTRDEAARARQWMIDKTGTAPTAVGAYACKHCSGFHIGHRRPDSNEGRRGRRSGRRR